jgi:hypothetical protein
VVRQNLVGEVQLLVRLHDHAPNTSKSRAVQGLAQATAVRAANEVEIVGGREDEPPPPQEAKARADHELRPATTEEVEASVGGNQPAPHSKRLHKPAQRAPAGDVSLTLDDLDRGGSRGQTLDRVENVRDRKASSRQLGGEQRHLQLASAAAGGRPSLRGRFVIGKRERRVDGDVVAGRQWLDPRVLWHHVELEWQVTGIS